MPGRFLSGLSFALPLLVGASLASADVYTWTDAKGRVNVSNLAPPEGARVTSVVHENPPTPAQIEARETARLAEMQALADRVRQLESDAESARAPVMPPIAYAPMPQAPTIVQYINEAPAAPEQYAASAPVTNGYCDPMWSLGCGAWFYTSPVVVVRQPGRRHWNGGRSFGHARPPHRSNDAIVNPLNPNFLRPLTQPNTTVAARPPVVHAENQPRRR